VTARGRGSLTQRPCARGLARGLRDLWGTWGSPSNESARYDAAGFRSCGM
jgi:hypothetical protein